MSALLAVFIGLVFVGCSNDFGTARSAVVSLTFPAELVKSTVGTTVPYSVEAELYDADTQEEIEKQSSSITAGNSLTLTFAPVEVGRTIFISVSIYDGTSLYASGSSDKHVMVAGEQQISITLTRNSGETMTGTGTITGKATISADMDNSKTIVYIEQADSDSTGGTVMYLATSDSASVTIKDVVAQTKASADGSFSFTGLKAGTYSVFAANATSLEQAAFDTVIVGDNATTEVTLTFTAVGTISGTILVNGDKSSSSGVVVFVPGTNYLAVTKADGTFVISNVPATSTGSTYSLSALYNGKVYSVASGVTVTGGKDTATASFTFFQSSNVSYATCTATATGILFSGYVPVLTTESNNSRYNVRIEDKVNGITADKSVYGNARWYLLYPLVAKDKTYTFKVGYTDANWNDYYNEYFTVQAIGGSGEYYVTNTEKLAPTFDTSTLTISRSVTPEYSPDCTAAVSRYGTNYILARGTDWGQADTKWLCGGDRWDDNSDSKTYPIQTLDSSNYNKYCCYLSNNNYFVNTRSVINLALCPGWRFLMNDYSLVKGAFGGSKVTVTTVYGVEVVLPNGNTQTEEMFSYSDTTGKEALTAKLNEKGLKMPSSITKETALTINGSLSTYMYTTTSNYGDAFIAPDAAPTATNYRFDRWIFNNLDTPELQYHDPSSPVSDGTTTSYVDYCLAVFVPTKMTVTYNTNYPSGTDATATTSSTELTDNGSSAWNVLTFGDDPTRENYTFCGWFTNAACTSTSLDGKDSSVSTGMKKGDTLTLTGDVTLYAKWAKISTVAIGQIYYSDNTWSSTYDSTKTPVGIVCELSNDGTAVKKIMGLKEGTGLAWSPESTTGSTTTFGTSESDGSSNWTVITTSDENASITVATNYPVFNFANAYGTTDCTVSDFTSGWYVPAKDELSSLYNNMTAINNGITAITSTGSSIATALSAGNNYWSSSQCSENTNHAWVVSFSDGDMIGGTKYTSQCVRVIRAF